MLRKMKTIVPIVTIFVLLASTVLVGSVSAATPAQGVGKCPQKITIGWAPPDITGVFKTATNYFDATAKEATEKGIPIEVITQSPASHTSFSDQVAILEDYIQRKVNVIALSPIDVNVVKPPIKKANEAGIPVIVVNQLEPIEGLDVTSYIGFDNTDGGRISAYAVVDYFGGPGVLGTGAKIDVKPDTILDLKWWQNVFKDVDPKTAPIKANIAIIEGIAGSFHSNARLKGFHEIIDAYPGIKIVGTQPADWNREKGIKAAEDFLTANPKGSLDGMWAASNEMGLGAALAAEKDGRLAIAGKTQPNDGTVAIFTNDVTPESADRMREGKLMAETDHGFPEWGHYGAEFAATLACGGKIPLTFDTRPRTMFQGNADSFYPNRVMEPIKWDEIKAGGSPRMTAAVTTTTTTK